MDETTGEPDEATAEADESDESGDDLTKLLRRVQKLVDPRSAIRVAQ
jgi:hypothetical protein